MAADFPEPQWPVPGILAEDVSLLAGPPKGGWRKLLGSQQASAGLRGHADGILHVTGRDVDEAEYALSFQPASGAWHLLDGPVTDHTEAGRLTKDAGGRYYPDTRTQTQGTPEVSELSGPSLAVDQHGRN
ncbi:hypothetical protein ACFYRG_41250 [Streptomyces mirabilis]|uniref:hypothetical protein n=1 Tax=Streptomyces mirabilis TaxID=68239 RepID=UPI0036A6D330